MFRKLFFLILAFAFLALYTLPKTGPTASHANAVEDLKEECRYLSDHLDALDMDRPGPKLGDLYPYLFRAFYQFKTQPPVFNLEGQNFTNPKDFRDAKVLCSQYELVQEEKEFWKAFRLNPMQNYLSALRADFTPTITFDDHRHSALVRIVIFKKQIGIFEMVYEIDQSPNHRVLGDTPTILYPSQYDQTRPTLARTAR